MSGKHIYAEAVIVLTPPPRKKILFFIQVPQKQDVQQVQGPCEAMYHKMLIPTCWGWRQGQGGMLEQGESEKEINQLGPSRVNAVLCPVLAEEGPGIRCKGYQSLFFFMPK